MYFLREQLDSVLLLMSVCVRRLWIIYGITKAVEIRSGLCGYVWMSDSRGPLVFLTMHLNFQSLCYDLRSEKPDTLNITNITCVY